MKIAMMFIGLCRPKVEDCIDNIETLKSKFCLHDVDTYLTEYNTSSSRILAEHVDNLILTKRESDEFINGLFPSVQCNNAIKGYTSQTNIWRLRRKINYTMKFIENTGIKYDYLIYSRPCTKIVLDADDWIYKGLGGDCYNTIRAEIEWIDDRFAMARPDIMKKVWGYENESELADFDGINDDESFVRHMCNKNKIKVRMCTAYVGLRKEK